MQVWGIVRTGLQSGTSICVLLAGMVMVCTKAAEDPEVEKVNTIIDDGLLNHIDAVRDAAGICVCLCRSGKNYN